MKKTTAGAILALSAAALVLGPMPSFGTGGLSLKVDSAYAKNNKSNANSGNHGNSGNAGGNSGNHGNAGGNSGNNGNSGKNGNAGNANGKSSVSTQSASIATSPSTANGKSGKQKNLHALLGGLNSLKRNPDALLNSNDPRMKALVQYATDLANTQFDLEQALAAANAAVTDAQTALTTAQGTYDTALADFNTAVGAAGLTSYDTTSPYDYTNQDNTTYDALTQHLADLQASPVTDPTDPNYDAYTAEVQSLQTLLGGAEATALNTATTDLATADTNLTTAQGVQATAQTNYDSAASTDFQIDGTATSLASLDAAILAGANPNFSWKYGDITPEMQQWIEDTLGVGSSTGVVDTIYSGLTPTP